jgi:hypothetical protein
MAKAAAISFKIAKRMAKAAAIQRSKNATS